MSRPSSATSVKTDAGRRLVVSFHDLHPGTRATCEPFLAQLAARGVARASLLVVPRWHGAPAVTTDPAFVGWLRSLAAQGHDLCLHGYFHRADAVRGGPWARWMGRVYTQGEGEFHQLTREIAADRIRRGLEILVTEAGLPVVGFTAPAWLLSAGGRAAATEAGLAYSTRFGGIDLLPQNEYLPAPVLVWSTRNAWRRVASRRWVRFWAWRQRAAPVLRIAAHPGDFADARVTGSVLAQVEQAVAAGRRPVTYREIAESAGVPARLGPPDPS